MRRIITLPNDIDLISQGRRDYWVQFEHPSIWGNEMVPLTVIVGPNVEEGKGLLATGSVHGDEYEGPVALKNICSEIKIEDVLGRIILIPVLNVAAFRAGQRDTPTENQNLNRVFPGNANGSLTERFAAMVTEQLFPAIDTVLDLHAGGMVARFPLATSFHHVSDTKQLELMKLLARGFGTPFTTYYQNHTAGLLTSTAEAAGKATIGGEFGFGRSLTLAGISAAKRGVLHAGFVTGNLKELPLPDVCCQESEQKFLDGSEPNCVHLAVRDALFEPCVETGDQVSKDSLLGYLHDFQSIDDTPLKLTANLDGYVISLPMSSRVQQGQVISTVAYPIDWN